MKLLIRFFSVLLVLTFSQAQAQLSGTFTIPGNYATIGAAVTDLNTQGVNGPVTMQVAAGHTETVSVGGYSLFATGTSTSPVIFQKSGAGANPLLTAYSGGAATSSSAFQDGIFRLIGSDHVTIDGIDLSDPNTSNPSTMEFGYAFFKASATNGCNNNIIKNCVITLNRANDITGIGPAADGSRGIDMVNALVNSHTLAAVPTSTDGSNSNNKFYSNLIQNCNIGISLAGYSASTPFNYVDSNNEIGGNSMSLGNTIINFGGGGTNNPAAAISTLAQYNLVISFNTINNNNGSGINHGTVLRGFFINTAANANVTVTNNTLTLNSGATTSSLYVIDNLSGSSSVNNTVSISNNLIANCTYTGATTGVFRGISNSGNANVLSVNSNTFLNNSTFATSGSFVNIFNSGTVVATASFDNNKIDLGTFNAASTSLMLGGIFNTTGGLTSTLSISGNTLQNANFTGASGGSGLCYLVYNAANMDAMSLNSNVFDNLVLKNSNSVLLISNSGNVTNASVNNNSIRTAFNKTLSGGTFYGYYCFNYPAGTAYFNSNNFSNITLVGATECIAMYQRSSNAQILSTNNNTITNLSTGADNLYGIFQSNGASGSSINSNVINNLSGGSTVYGIYIDNLTSSLLVTGNTVNTCSTTAASPVYGVYFTGSSNITLVKNKIYDLSGSHASSRVYGIYGNACTAANIQNNLVGDLRAGIANAVIPISGIHLAGGNSISMSYNTVHLSASSSGINFGTSALYAATGINLELRNNILINNSTANGTGKTVAYRRSSTAISTYSATSNNNIFYAGAAPSSSYCIFFDGTNTYSTLAAYTNFVAPRDISSYTENTSFISTAGSSSNFLHISNVPPSVAESNGVAISGITEDADGQVRYGNPGYAGTGTGVDIGADEYNGTNIDQLAPVITHTGVGITCSTGDRTVSATITDNVGVLLTGTLTPKIYFKRNTGSYTYSSGTLTSGSASNGVWTFTISSAALSGVVLNDVISYFIIAQDTYSNVNIGSGPSAGLSATSVTSVAVPPSNPYQYTVAALAGTYSVGAGGNYTTLGAAATAYNNSCLNGPVNFVLTDALYSTAETFPVIFQNNTFASATNSLSIYPAPGVTTAITPTLISIQAVFKFNDARYITLDGLNTGGSALVISNSNSATANAGIWLASETSGCNTIGLKNLKLNGSSNTVIASFGVLSAYYTSPTTAAGADNDNISIEGLDLSGYNYGIYAIGSTNVLAGAHNNWSVTNNQIGPVVSSPLTNIGGCGMFFQNVINLSVAENTVSNVQGSLNYVPGILLSSGVSNATLSANKITSIKYTGTAGGGAIGIDLQTGSATSNLLIKNNMISDLVGRGGTGFTNGGSAGVRMSTSFNTGGVKFYNNSIAMNHSTTIPGHSTASVSACMYFGSSTNDIELVNNLLYSNIQYTNTGAKTYAIYSAAPNTAFTAMNYNNYSTEGPQGVLARLATTNLTTLAGLQTAFGNNASSQTITPAFVSLTDLHLVPTANVFLDNLGTPVAGITTDFDGQSRSLSTPDIGADEFSTPNCSTVSSTSIFTPNSFTACASQSIALALNNLNELPGIQQNWQISNSAGGPYTIIAAATGTSYNTPTLSPGTYYYVSATTCTFTSLIAVSNEATVTIYPYPNLTLSQSSSSICMPGGIPVILSASGALSYSWSPSTNLNTTTGATVNALPTVTRTYVVTGINAGPCTSTASAVINVLPAAGGLTVTATPTLMCEGSSANLSAIGTSTVYDVNSIPFAPITTPPTGVGTLCNGGAAVTPITSGNLDDGNWYLLTIPFNFNFYTFNANQISVSTNGFITFGNVTPNTFSGYGQPFPAFSAGRPGIGTVYSNLSFANTGIINEFTTGTSPNRRYVVNWIGGRFSATNSGTVTTQLILYETSNVIEVHTTISTGQSPAVEGIQNDNATLATVVPGRNNQTFSVTNDAHRWTRTVNFNWLPATFLSSPTVSNPTASGVMANTDYTVFATAGNGCVRTAVVSLSVIPSPTLSITGGINAVCAGTSVSLTANGSTSYTWTNGPQTSTFTPSPAVTTTYIVSGSHSTNTCIGTAAQIVTVTPNPAVSISGSSVICEGNSVTLTANGADTYSWSTGALTSSITSSPLATSIFSVTGTNILGGCTGTAVTTLTVYQTPTVSISGTSIICSGKNANLNVTGASTYSWSNGATATSIFPLLNTTSVFSVTGTLSPGGCTASATQTVTVNPTPTIVTSGTTAICAGQSATISVSGANSYSWTNGATQTLITVTPNTTTVYNVTGTNTANGCTNVAVQVLNVTPVPVVNISGPAAICMGQGATFLASGATTYSWNTGSIQSSITNSPTGNTAYSVTGTSGPGCSSSATVALTVNSLPTATILSSPPDKICEGETAELSSAVNGATTYSWSTSATSNSISVTPLVSTVYTLQVGNSTTGCSTIVSYNLQVDPCTGIEKHLNTGLLNIHPNPFNNEFYIETDQTIQTSFEIFDTSGRMIQKGKISSGKTSIDMSSYSKGVYYLKFEGGPEVYKIVSY